MITLSKIELSFGSRTIFDEITLSIQPEDRIGLVGRNGYGKSTLLKVIAGQQELDNGAVVLAKGRRIAYLNQDIIISSEDAPVSFVVQEALKDEALMYDNEAILKAQADKMLRGLGFTPEMLEKPINTLSGGWKMRVVLAYLLLLRADFYLFDEPTNHLDIVAKDWFLNFLQHASFGFLLVCHEKHFLNVLCKKIFALDTPQGKLYMGNYTDYAERMKSDRAALELAYVQQQKMIKQKRDTIARFRASAARSTQAQSMMKELENLTLIELPDDLATMHIPLPEIKPSGKQVLSVDKLTGGYDITRPLFVDASLTISRGEKVALVAANGVGKTTLLYTIAGLLKPFSGSITYGYNTNTALFHQEQGTVLDPQATIWEEVTKVATGLSDATIRSMLGCFLFSGDAIHKKIRVLSGGEKSRVGMIKVLLAQANFLLLDEPTNHLDIQSKDILLSALQRYEGTLFFVSHDRDFINQLATTIMELSVDGITVYPGNYDDYVYLKERTISVDKHNSFEGSAQAVKKNMHVASLQDTSKALKKIEQTSKKLDAERARLSEELGEYEYGTVDFTVRYQRLQEIERESERLWEQWISLQDQ